MKRRHGRTPSRGNADDPVAGFIPAEVLVPELMTRVEEAHGFARDGIDRRNAICLMIVAQRARKPEVFFLAQTAERLRDQVVQLHRTANDRFRAQTLTAAVSRRGANASADFFGNVRTTHGLPAASEIGCPRSLRRAAARARRSIVRSACWT